MTTIRPYNNSAGRIRHIKPYKTQIYIIFRFKTNSTQSLISLTGNLYSAGLLPEPLL